MGRVNRQKNDRLPNVRVLDADAANERERSGVGRERDRGRNLTMGPGIFVPGLKHKDILMGGDEISVHPHP